MMFTVTPTISSADVMSAAPSRHFDHMPASSDLFIKYISKRQIPPVTLIVQCVYPRQITSKSEYPAAPVKKTAAYSINQTPQKFKSVRYYEVNEIIYTDLQMQKITYFKYNNTKPDKFQGKNLHNN